MLNEREGILGYWEPQHGKHGTLGVGSVIPVPVTKMKVNDQHPLAVVSVNSDKSFVYYAGAAWNNAGTITSSNEWFDYLENFKTKLQRPLLTEWL